MINWKVRLKNKIFWIAIIPAVLVLAQTIAALFGYQLELTELQGRLLDIVNAVFVILAIVGVVVDPTTNGVSDSTRALTYDEPKRG